MASQPPQIPALQVLTEDRGTTRTISIEGEIDIGTASALSSALGAGLSGQHLETVVVNLADVSFIDSTGLHILLEAHAATSRDGIRLVLLPGPPAVQRVFEVSGLMNRLPFVLDAQAAGRGLQ